MLWQHDPSQPIGVWDEVAEDDTGLYVKGRILDAVEKGREARALIEAGAIDGMSIGYRTLKADRGPDGARMLKELELWEISMVTFPMLTSARVDTIKAAEMTRREMEALLTQDAGLSRSVARALMDGGMGAVKAMQDAGGDGLSELAQYMRATLGKKENSDG
jgi:phage head maturation protease